MWTAIFNYILYTSYWKHISQNGSYVQQNTIFNLFFHCYQNDKLSDDV